MPQPGSASAAAAAEIVRQASRGREAGKGNSRNIEPKCYHAARAKRAALTVGDVANMTTDTGFIAVADAALTAIGEALDRALETSDVDVDWMLNDGILEIECEDGSKIIVNRHLPNREIWVAARDGGFHFRARAGCWRDTRSDAELGAALAALLRSQAGITVALPPLAAPPD
jgi:CyaY protein